MVDVNIDNQGAWHFAGKLIDHYPLITLIVSIIVIFVIVALGVRWVATIILNKGKVGEISKDVKAIKKHLCDE